MLGKLGPLPALLLIGMGLAGCISAAESSGGPGADPAAPKTASGPASFGEGQGAIAGQVTDEEINPVPGAQIGILKSDAIPEEIAVLADEAGAFTINNVPAGTHTVVAGALGYEARAIKVTVIEGEVVTQGFVLEKIVGDIAWMKLDTRKAAVTGVMVKLTPQCMYNLLGDGNTLAKTCQGVRTACDPSANCEVHYTSLLEDNPNWLTMLGEVSWQSQSVGSGRGFMFDINAPNVPRGQGGSINQGTGYTFFKMYPNPPIIWRINNPDTLIERKIKPEDYCCDWFYRLFPGYCDLGANINNCEATPDYGIANANPATVYISFFFNEPAPLDYSALPDR